MVFLMLVKLYESILSCLMFLPLIWVVLIAISILILPITTFLTFLIFF